MPLIINTNIGALNAQRQLVQSGNDLSQAQERLASGRRVNTARDDAAGLAISNRQTSQIRGLNQAIRNANDGVSLIQTAEGALDETTNILQRMRELAIQSSNGIYSDRDRATLDAEVQQLKAEMDRIASSTSFNGQPLLDGTLSDVDLQVGSEANQTIRLSIGGFSTSSLGSSSGDIVGEATTGIAAVNTLVGGDELIINDVPIGGFVTLDDDTVNEVLAKMNADLSGKGAEISTLVSYSSPSAGSGVLIPGETLTLTLKDGNGADQTYEITGTNSMTELVERINTDTIIDAKLNDDGKLVLSASNAESIQIQDGSAGVAATGAATNNETEQFRVVLTDTSAEKAGVKVEAGANLTPAELAALGLNMQDDNQNLLGTALAANATASINAGDLNINGIAIRAIDASGAAASNDVAAVIEAVNEKSEETGVVAFLGTGDQVALRSTTGSAIAIRYGDGANATNIYALTGLQEQNAAEGSGSVSGINISTAVGAQAAIDVIDLALEEINDTRSDLGAINNRLDFTVSNLANVSEKTSAARSRIVDADYASETSLLSRAQVLQQASQAILAQANAAPQQVLQLLQG